ncbi:MAG: Na(+)/H(+) antiporter subunit B [Rickettsiales bacterium]|nr:Na(+)/H(+) antiporter subunit B [Rickettsiales bacterium]
MIRQRIVLRTSSSYLTPFIIMFGCYVQLHGDYSPGGGFQAGVICAAAFVLYGLITTMEEMFKVLPMAVMRIMACLGPLAYGAVGVAAMLYGGEFLNYSAFDPEHPSHGQHIGIVIIELGVGVTVFSVMMIIFSVFVSREKKEDAS